MKINNVEFNVELETVLVDLRNELEVKYGMLLFEKMRDSGNDIMVQCPYHANGHERRPSAGIRKSDGQFHCFSCGESHTFPEIVSHCFGRDDDVFGTVGWNWLLKNYVTVVVEERKDIELDFGTRGNIAKQNAAPKYVTESELDGYRYFHPYMYERKLTDEIIELFDIGYDKKTQCLTFPVRDIMGNCLFVARRSVNTKYFNYPKGVEKPVYGLYELYHHCWESFAFVNDSILESVIVCESMIDALTCWTYGKLAVALNGTGNELQFRQLNELRCRKLVLATDNDNAGMTARKKIRDHVKNKIITEYVFPDGVKDINEMDKQTFDSLTEVF